jgi:hypothetical protein
VHQRQKHLVDIFFQHGPHQIKDLFIILDQKNSLGPGLGVSCRFFAFRHRFSGNPRQPRVAKRAQIVIAGKCSTLTKIGGEEATPFKSANYDTDKSNDHAGGWAFRAPV